uniref:Exostosin GT47 domain-containing protein n=1 Tax=Kalanchoe fedtschenkoi TaxID=63787 RepID=A0A7N0TFL0_KALFE
MSNYFRNVKLGRWLFTVGVSVCLGIVLLSRIVSRSWEFSSTIPVFWVGISPLSLPQSLNTPSVLLGVEPNVTATCFSVEQPFSLNDEQLSKGAVDHGVGISSATPAVGYLLHKGIGAINGKPSHVGTSDDAHPYASQKDTFSDGCFSQAAIKNVANGSLISTKVPDHNSNGLNKNASVKSPPSLTFVVPSSSSRRGSEKFIKKNNDANIIQGSPHDAPKVNLNLSRMAEPASISDMSLSLHKAASSFTLRPRWSSAPDKQLVSAKLQLQNVPILHTIPSLDASVYRNVSLFRRSYELMGNILKVYIYGEGEKPVFHQPILDGIYASEGWFIKLMEEDKQFRVQDPSKAHLFFLPFSLKRLRALFYRKFHSWKSRTLHINNYVDLISAKYPFWNRTQGADHFLVACHDWGLRLTAGRTKNCIRALCNANTADGFRIGKDATLPVTFVRKAEEPLRDLGVKLPSKRPTLAFFAGSMHGDVRPILVKYWQNKVPDMMILGSLPRNGQGQKVYRDHMKHSKYCICARGYEVHTPRIVEAIFQECVPVIIADNYVPPFFEVLNWESFAVFVKEKDVPDLRKILVSIPQHKYRLMQQRVKVIQKHFLWHKNPIPFDLFHMILHSVWHNRLAQMKI